MTQFYFLARMPLACMMIVAFALAMFNSHRQLKTASYKAFLWLIVSGVMHICASAVTEYTVNNADTVPTWLNDGLHDVFIISLICFMAMFLFYAILQIEKSRRKHFKALRYTVFSLATLCGIVELFLPLEYTTYATVEKYNINLYYSMGAKAYCLYAFAAFTVVLIVVLLVFHGKKLRPAKRTPLFATALILVAISIIQVTFPYILLTALGVTLIILGVMLSLEDKQQFLKQNSTLYNENGSSELLKELIVHGGHFQAGAYVFAGNPNDIEDAMLEIQQKLLPEEQTKLFCCSIGENLLTVVPSARTALSQIPELRELPLPEHKNNFEYEVKIFDFCDEHSLSAITKRFLEYRNDFLERQHNRDELTETIGRNALIRSIEKLIAEHTSFTFLMLDFDTFKLINDIYGHQTGDQVLVKASDSMRAVLRSTDLICRMGGDEFWLLLPGLTDTKRISEISDNLRKELSEIKVKQATINLNYSMGARVIDFEKETTPIDFDTVYTDADNALYHAKHLGKGRLVFSQRGGEQTNKPC